MPVTRGRYLEALDAIDAVNAQDPNRVEFDGSWEPLALVQGRAATRWVRRLAIRPSEPLLLAARAHHVRRWEVSRSTYPDGRAGYLAWRTNRMEAHAREASEILTQAGYGGRVVDRVRAIIRKERIRSDQEVQTYEDAAALVFLETQLDDMAARLGSKTGDVLSKTIRKMSPTGIAAIPELPAVPENLIDEALRTSRRVDRCHISPLAWSDPVAQAHNLIRLALIRSKNPVITLSGQLGGVALLHMVKEVAPTIAIPVVFADTGYHFPQTLEFIDELRRAWDLDLRVVSPRRGIQRHDAAGSALYDTDPDTCCALRKVAPVGRALVGHDTWFTAVRRDQSASRSNFQAVTETELEDGHTIVKVNPLIGWSWEIVERYTDTHGLPRHPLYGEGYTSIGCAPCTTPSFATADDRRGRWAGTKVECGLHIEGLVPR